MQADFWDFRPNADIVKLIINIPIDNFFTLTKHPGNN